MIPNILYFTYKTNLLTDPVDTKDQTLASNIKHIQNTVPNAKENEVVSRVKVIGATMLCMINIMVIFGFIHAFKGQGCVNT